MNNNSNNCGDCGTTCSECGRPWAICKQDGGCGCNKCKDIKFCEYGRMANGCIREKQPGCPMQAVIPSVTVESIEGIKSLADCLVHVSDINTTFYIDDKHRPIITWAGPIDIPGYDMEGNPNNYRDQIVTDVANQMAVIYDKSGKGYMFGLAENIDLQEEVNNKLDEMVEDGTFDEIINETIFNELEEKVDGKEDIKTPRSNNISYERLGRLVDETFLANSSANGYFGMQGGAIVDENTIVIATNHFSGMDTYADELCKLRKIDLRDGSILAEKTVTLGHANGMCYDPSAEKYYVAPAHGNVVSSDYANKIITLDSGMNYVQIDTVANNYDSLSIDNNGDLYAGITYKGNGDGGTIFRLDKTDFSVLSTITLELPVSDTIGTGQDFCVYDGYIYFLQYNPNAIFVFDMEGNYIRSYSLNDNEIYSFGELENINAVGDGKFIIGSAKQPTGNLYSFEQFFIVDLLHNIPVTTSKRLYFIMNQPYNPYNAYVDPDSTVFAPDGTSDKPFACIDEITELGLKNYCKINLVNGKTYKVSRINSFNGYFENSSNVTIGVGDGYSSLQIRNSNIYFNYVKEIPCIILEENSNVTIYHSNFYATGADNLLLVKEGSRATLDTITYSAKTDLTGYLFANNHGVLNWGTGNCSRATSGYTAVTKWFDGVINFEYPFEWFNGTMAKTDTSTINNGNLTPFKMLDIRFNDLQEIYVPARNQEFQNILVNLSSSGTGNNTFRNVTVKLASGVLSISKAIQMTIASTTGDVTMNTDPTANIVNIRLQ